MKKVRAHMDARVAGEKGFTLIELLVVIAIIGILIAIAIPRFLGARRGAQNRAAQTSVREALSTLSTVEGNEGSLDGLSLGACTVTTSVCGLMQAAEPELAFSITTTPATDDSDNVALGGTPGGMMYLAARADTGNCWAIEIDTATSGAGQIRYGERTGNNNTCTAAVGGYTWDTNEW